LVLLLLRRRRSTDTTYLSHNIEGKGSLLDEDSVDSTSQEDSTTIPVISGDSTLSTGAFMDQNPQHDVKVCGSSMCPACRAEGPVFVPSKVDENIRDISPERLTAAESDRSYAMSNTVDL